MPRQAIASRVYHGQVKPLYSQVPAGYPGHIDAFAALYGRNPNPAKAKQVLAQAGLQTPFPVEIWWTPTHYGDASADEYAEIKRGLERNGVFTVTLKSTEWAAYSAVFGAQYNVFQLGWFPDYPDSENYLVPFYRSDCFHGLRVQQPDDGGADQEGAGLEDACPRGSSSSSRSSCWRRRTCRSSRTGSSR